VALLCLLSFWVFFSACDPETVEALKEEPIDEELIEVKEQPAVDVEVRDPRIPSLAYRLKRMIRGEINYHWGLGQDGTVFYAQIHQESGWNPKAKSAYASGLAQFTPDTADWISRLYPADLGDNNPLDVRWAIRAVIRYDKWLYDRFNFAFDNSNRWRFSLSGYNGGAGWVSRDRELTKARGKDPRKWICNVEHFSKRALWAFKENRDYVTKILDKWVPLYMKGGFV
jgi:soluble lytic murein transglycosylase-like protein